MSAFPRCLLSLLDYEALLSNEPLSFFSLRNTAWDNFLVHWAAKLLTLNPNWKTNRLLSVSANRKQIQKAESCKGWMECVSRCMSNDSFGKEDSSKHTQQQSHAVAWDLELLQTLETMRHWSRKVTVCVTIPFPNWVRLLGWKITPRSNAKPAK